MNQNTGRNQDGGRKMSDFRINKMLFPGGKKKALTLSYDDGVRQDRRLVELMNRYGVKGTFNLNTACFGREGTFEVNGRLVDDSTIDAAEVPDLYKGHEVATHASKHTALTGCGSAGLYEVLEDRKVLEGMVPYMVQGHAYPFGMYDKDTIAMLKAAGIRYARTVLSTEDFNLPEDFLEWHPTCHHVNPRLMELAKRFCEQDGGGRNGKLPQVFYLWGHSYEFDRVDNWNVIEEFLVYMSENADKIWMATNGEIVDYVTAYRNLVFSVDGSRAYNPSAQTVWVGSKNDEDIYEIPSGKTINLLHF